MSEENAEFRIQNSEERREKREEIEHG